MAELLPIFSRRSQSGERAPLGGAGGERCGEDEDRSELGDLASCGDGASFGLISFAMQLSTCRPQSSAGGVPEVRSPEVVGQLVGPVSGERCTQRSNDEGPPPLPERRRVAHPHSSSALAEPPCCSCCGCAGNRGGGSPGRGGVLIDENRDTAS